MFTYHNGMTSENSIKSRSAFEIAQSAHEHEKQLAQMRTYDLTVAKSRAERRSEKFLAFLKMPVHQLLMAGQWLFIH